MKMRILSVVVPTAVVLLSAVSAAQVAQTPSPSAAIKTAITKTGGGKPVAASPATLPGSGASLVPLVNGSDSCLTPDLISGSGPFSFDNSIATTGTEGQNNCVCNEFGTTNIDSDVWFRWTAGFTGFADASLCAGTPGSIDTRLAVYRGTACPTLPALSCNDDFCSFAGPSQTIFKCVAGQNYILQVGTYPGAFGGAGSFTINTLALVGNDDCSAATPISGIGPHSFNNQAATTGSEGQCNSACNAFGTTAIANDVWFTWTAGFSGLARASLCVGASFLDTRLAVYNGGGCPPGANLACDDDFCGFAGASQVVFNAVSGSVYLIQVGNYPGAAGGIGTFTVDPYTPPPGDDCSSPIAISGAGPHSFDTTQATTGSQGQNEGLCFFFGTSNFESDAWFTWASPCTGPVIVSMCNGSTNDAKLAVYAGAGCPTGSALACDDDFCCAVCPSEVTFNAISGQTYTIQVGSYPGSGGAMGAFTTICQVPIGPMTAMCFPGVGGVIGCPCGNNPVTTGAGCDNSGPAADGATLTASGIASLSSDTLFLTSSGETTSATSTPPSIILQGDLTLPTGANFGDGLRCVGGVLKRLYVKPAVAGSVSAPNLGAGDLTISARSAFLGDTIVAGQHRFYMAYYRDPDATFCPALTFNASQAGDVLWGP